MNNQCPSCGAVYNVAAKDIGRKIKCKKCSTALVVGDDGLEVDAAAGGRSPADDAGYDDGGDVAPRRGKKKGGNPLEGLDPLQIFKDFGGIATLFFGFGAFLVIVFLFMPIIGAAAVQRAEGASERLDLEWKTKQRKMEKDKKTADEINTEREKFYKDNRKDEVDENVGYERVGNKRALWMERYGMMFGFLFLMAGSLGFMMPGQTTVRRILGTVVLGAQVLVIFLIFAVTGGR